MMARQDRDADIVAEIRLLPTADGGRKGPIMSGYRPSHDLGALYDGQPMLNDGMHELVGVERLFPGEIGLSRLRMPWPEAQFGRLDTGKTFTIQEGPKVIGHGTIIEVINPQMRRR